MISFGVLFAKTYDLRATKRRFERRQPEFIKETYFLTNISGILVVVPPHCVAAMTASLNSIPGVSVHYTEPGSGRIIITQEAETTSAEIDGLQRIKALPDVVVAELVYHYFEDETDESTNKSGEGNEKKADG